VAFLFNEISHTAGCLSFSPILDWTPMLLTIRTTHRPATDLGFLLHKRVDPDHGEKEMP
jgi:hypothetical protein